MDKYTKFILTMIAVALFGINYHMLGGEIISKAEAYHIPNNRGDNPVGQNPYRNHIWIDNMPNCN